jgi:hypothetical protein
MDYLCGYSFIILENKRERGHRDKQFCDKQHKTVMHARHTLSRYKAKQGVKIASIIKMMRI